MPKDDSLPDKPIAVQVYGLSADKSGDGVLLRVHMMNGTHKFDVATHFEAGAAFSLAAQLLRSIGMSPENLNAEGRLPTR